MEDAAAAEDSAAAEDGEGDSSVPGFDLIGPGGGGQVRAISAAGDRVLASIDCGGPFASEDVAESWRPVARTLDWTLGSAVKQTENVWIDPADDRRAFFSNKSGQLYLSSDGGNIWRRPPVLDIAADHGCDRGGLGAFLRDGETLLAANRNYWRDDDLSLDKHQACGLLLRSDDDGAAWTLAAVVGDGTNNIYALARDSPGRYWAATRLGPYHADSPAGPWTPKTDGLPQYRTDRDPRHPWPLTTGIAAAGEHVYVTALDDPGDPAGEWRGGVWRATVSDLALPWEPWSTGLADFDEASRDGFETAANYLFLHADPADPGLVWASTWSMPWLVGGELRPGGIYASRTDAPSGAWTGRMDCDFAAPPVLAGGEWLCAATGGGPGNVSLNLHYRTYLDRRPGRQILDFAFGEGGVIHVAGDNVVFRSTDGGASWRQTTSVRSPENTWRTRGIDGHGPRAILHDGSERIVILPGDYGVKESVDGGVYFDGARGGDPEVHDGTRLAFDPLDPSSVIVSGGFVPDATNGYVHRVRVATSGPEEITCLGGGDSRRCPPGLPSGAKEGLAVRADGGMLTLYATNVEWSADGDPLAGKVYVRRGDLAWTVLHDPTSGAPTRHAVTLALLPETSPTRLAVTLWDPAGRAAVALVRDDGADGAVECLWTLDRSSRDIPIRAAAARGGVLWVGTTEGRVYVDDGLDVSGPAPDCGDFRIAGEFGSAIGDLAVHEDTGRLAVATRGAGLRFSDDRGASWTDLGDRVPSLDLSAVAFNPSDAGEVYAGARCYGTYRVQVRP